MKQKDNLQKIFPDDATNTGLTSRIYKQIVKLGVKKHHFCVGKARLPWAGGAGLGHGAASSRFQGPVPGAALGIISGDSPTLVVPLSYVPASL